MSLWLIVPRDPLIFRDGKPFTATPGERSKSLVFPFPSTIAGAVRTLAGTDAATGQFDKKRIAEVKQIAIRGLVLVELNEDGQIKNWFFPAPADALLVDADIKGQAERYSLAPIEMQAGAFYDLEGLNLVGPANNVKNKPCSKPPLYWRWEQYKAWLENPVDGPVLLDDLGIIGPQRESRTHVSINAATQTALSGALFQTSGMEFVQLKKKEEETPKLKDVRHLAIAVETDAEMQEGVDFLGGERRVVRWQKTQAVWPDCPEAVKEKIIHDGHCRLLLLTPAFFEKGHLPTWLQNGYGVQVSVEAAATPRHQTISGWDYDLRKPKPTRRLVPAGSVFFLELNGDETAIQDFVKNVWMQFISDDEQSRWDGFGMAILGTWDGKLRKMEVQS